MLGKCNFILCNSNDSGSQIVSNLYSKRYQSIISMYFSCHSFVTRVATRMHDSSRHSAFRQAKQLPDLSQELW